MRVSQPQISAAGNPLRAIRISSIIIQHQSCIWTNRSYCTNFSVSWPLYYSFATAPASLPLLPGVFENTMRLSWSGAASGVNNGISTYRCYYQYSDNSGGSWSGETGVDSGGAGYINVNTASWPRGRLIRFHIPNTPTGMPTTNKSIYLPDGEFVAKVKIQYPDGPDYNSGQIIGTNASGSATSASVLTTDWIQRVLVNS